MRTLMSMGTLCALSFGFTSANEAQALPTDRTIIFTIFENPNDPQSNILYVVELDLAADSSLGESVGWEVLEARITKPATGGSANTIWSELFPVVNSSDGLWWIDHVSGNNPDVSEFVIPPSIQGTAIPDDPSIDDLVYALAGGVYTPPPQPYTPPFQVTTSLSFSFQLSLAPEPDAEADDLPVDTDADDHDL